MTKKIINKKTVARADVKKLIFKHKLDINKDKFVFFDADGKSVKLAWSIGVRSSKVDSIFWITFFEMENCLYYFSEGNLRPVPSGRANYFGLSKKNNQLAEVDRLLLCFGWLTLPVQSELIDNLALLVEKIEAIKNKIEQDFEPNEILDRRCNAIVLDMVTATDTLVGYVATSEER